MAAVICDICGGNLMMDASGEFAVCESCGMKHSKDRVKAKVQEIKGVVEVTKGEAEKDRLKKNAETFLQMNDLYNALLIYDELSKTYPDSSEIWQRMLTIIVNYGVCLHHTTDYGQPKSVLTDSIGDVADEIIRVFKAYTSVSSTKEPIEKYTQIYYYNLCNGSITTSSYFDENDLKKILTENQVDFIMTTGKNNANAVNRLNILQEVTGCQHYDRCEFYFGRIIHCSYSDYDSTYHNYRRVERVANARELSERLEIMINTRKSNNLCRHCGGQFKGIFNKVCSKCGMTKDY